MVSLGWLAPPSNPVALTLYKPTVRSSLNLYRSTKLKKCRIAGRGPTHCSCRYPDHFSNLGGVWTNSFSVVRRQKELELTNQHHFYQSLATAGPVVITANGLHHEFMGEIVFPWGPDFLGGPIGWHGFTLLVVVYGVVMLLGTVRVLKLPVYPMVGLAILVCCGLLLASAILHQQFHGFAFTSLVAVTVTAVCYRKSSRSIS